MKELDEIRYQLESMMEKEHLKLCRLWWRAKRHGCSEETLRKIADERDWMYSNSAYPERIIAWDFKYKFKYAFR